MNARELRIGNRLILNGIYIVVDEQTFWDMKSHPEEYDPIPLSEEILLRCGFNKCSFFDDDRKFPIFEFCNIHICIIDGAAWLLCYDETQCDKERRLNGFHDLQNLYFVLTGEELEIKL